MILLFGQAALMPVFPHTGFSLDVNNLISLSLVATAALARIWWLRGELRVLPLAALLACGSAFIVPSAAFFVAVASVIRYDATKVSWAMANDAVWNTMLSRFIVNDNGLLASVHPNPAPLTNEIIASVLSVGRSALPAVELLEHDISREIQVLMFLTAATSVLVSLAVGRAFGARQLWLRTLFSVGAGLIPWTWFIGGFAFRLGFYNVSLTFLALVAVWIIWLEAERAPRAATALLLLSSTVIVAIWAPLVLVPSAMALVAAIRYHKDLFRMHPVQGALWLTAGVQFLVYLVVVTVPDLRRDGDALSSNGAMINIWYFDVIAIAAIMLAVVLWTRSQHDSQWEVRGALIVLITGSLGVAYLIIQRLGINDPWGYYPAKLGWLAGMLAIVIVATSVARHVAEACTRSLKSLGSTVAAGLIVIVALIQVPPDGFGITDLFPALSITRSDGMSLNDVEAQTLFAYSDPNEKILLVRYFPIAEQDLFVNGWLLQQTAELSSDELRAFAYPTEAVDVDKACDTITTWGGGVAVQTRDVTLEAELQQVCSDVDFTVVVTPADALPMALSGSRIG